MIALSIAAVLGEKLSFYPTLLPRTPAKGTSARQRRLGRGAAAARLRAAICPEQGAGQAFAGAFPGVCCGALLPSACCTAAGTAA